MMRWNKLQNKTKQQQHHHLNIPLSSGSRFVTGLSATLSSQTEYQHRTTTFIDHSVSWSTISCLQRQYIPSFMLCWMLCPWLECLEWEIRQSQMIRTQFHQIDTAGLVKVQRGIHRDRHTHQVKIYIDICVIGF